MSPAASEMNTNISTARLSSAAGPNTLSNVKNSEIWANCFAGEPQGMAKKEHDQNQWQEKQ
jgi:hypothetical protein